MEWIKCSDHMPAEEVKQCIVINDGLIYYAIHGVLNGQHYFISDDDEGEDLENVTYWLTLPETPAKELNYYEMKELLLEEIGKRCDELKIEKDMNGAISMLFSWGIANEEKAKEFVKVHCMKKGNR